MNKEKELLYRNAYSELNEILKKLSKEQKSKIPKSFIENVSKNMNINYKFQYDTSKGILEQELLFETKALLVEIYERYITQEKELWNKYDNCCLNKIDNEKKKKYNINVFEIKDINNNEDNYKEPVPIIYPKGNIINRIFDKIKLIIQICFKNKK